MMVGPSFGFEWESQLPEVYFGRVKIWDLFIEEILFLLKSRLNVKHKHSYTFGLLMNEFDNAVFLCAV